jgi:hypothetical protein
MVNLGELYKDLSRYTEAELLYVETLEARRRVLGNDHPDTLESLYRLSRLNSLRGDAGRAMDWLRQAVEGGYANADRMAKDTDLESLHGREFDALVAHARQNAANRGAS